MVEPWLYRARIHAVTDGDTLIAYIDQGFDNFRIQRLRLKNVDTPELGTPEGEAAETFTREWVYRHTPALEWPFVVRTFISARKQTELTDKYSRYEAEVYRWRPGAHEVTDLDSLTADLLASGHARPWKP